MNKLGYRLFREASSYSANANAYQKICLVVRQLGGVIVVPRRCKDWVPDEFKKNAIVASLFSKDISHWCFHCGNEIHLAKIVLFSIFIRKPYVLFCWDPPGIGVRNRNDLKSRLRVKLMDFLFGLAVRRSRETIMNLHSGFIDESFGAKVKGKCRFFPNGTNVSLNQYAAAGVQHVRKRIAINSAFLSDKGCWEIAQLIVQIWGEDHAVSVVWIGFGKEMEDVRAWILNQGMPTENLIIPGRVTYPEAMRLLASCDFAVNMYRDVPSLRWNYVLKMPEFMSLGLPAVSVRLPGAGEYLKDGETGFSFSAGDTERAYNSIKHLLEHSDEVAHMRERCLRVVSQYDWSRINAQIEETVANWLHK